MKPFNCFLALTLILCAPALPVIATAADAQVVAQDLQKLRIPGKVSSVVWTRRDDSCTLQVVLQMTTEYQSRAKDMAQRAATGLPVAPLPTPNLPQVQVWLLKMDGSIVSRNPGSPAFPAVIKASDGVPLEYRYSFPQSAAQEAVAVAIVVDGVYSVEQLKTYK